MKFYFYPKRSSPAISTAVATGANTQRRIEDLITGQDRPSPR